MRRATGVKVGIFAIILVVGFVTFLKSVFDVKNVAFLKLAQDQSGSFDYNILTDGTASLVRGDVNYYSDDPFNYGDKTSDVSQDLLSRVVQSIYKNDPNHDNFEFLGFNFIKTLVF